MNLDYGSAIQNYHHAPSYHNMGRDRSPVSVRPFLLTIILIKILNWSYLNSDILNILLRQHDYHYYPTETRNESQRLIGLKLHN